MTAPSTLTLRDGRALELFDTGAAPTPVVVHHHGTPSSCTGWLALVVVLGLNGVLLDVDDDEAYDLVIGVAEGRVDLDGIVAVLARWCVAGGDER